MNISIKPRSRKFLALAISLGLLTSLVATAPSATADLCGMTCPTPPMSNPTPPPPVVTYWVHYLVGNSDSGTPPPDPSPNTFTSGQTLYVDGVGLLIKVGSLFNGWMDCATNVPVGHNWTMVGNINLCPIWISKTQTVIFDANGGSGTMSNQTASVATNLTTNAFTRPGYTFNSWNSDPAGGPMGMHFNNGDSYPFITSVKLYAQWTINSTFTVTYDGNCANACGTVPIDTTQYTPNFTVSVGAPPSQNKPGYTFGGWSMPGGMGPQIVTSFPILMNTTLTAVWNAAKTYMVTYMGDQYSTGQPPSDMGHYNLGDPVTLMGPNTLVRTGYSLTGWYVCGPVLVPETNPFPIPGNTDLCPIWTPNGPQTVTFVSNFGTDVLKTQTATGTTALTGNTFVRTGYQFNSWNSDRGGGGFGMHFFDHDTYGFAAPLTLYAQWTLVPTFTVTYDGNCSNLCGTVPVDTNNYPANAQVFVALPPGSTYSGFTFGGWALGGLQVYHPHDQFAITSNVTLTAVWTKDILYTVTYDGNCSNTCGSAPTDNLNPYSSGAVVFVTQSIGTLVKSGFSLTGWSVCATNQPVGNSFVILADTRLCPIWTPNPKFTITYLANGGTGNPPPVTSGNGLVPIVGNTGGMVKSGNHFSGWNTKADGSGVPYAVNFPYNLITNLTLHAVWIPTKNLYTITYDSNCSNSCGSPPAPTVGAGSVPLANNTGPMVKVANHFGGWNTNQSGTGTTYPAGNSYNLTVNVTLYALWIPDTFKVIYHDTGSTFGTAPTDPGSAYPSGAGVTVLTTHGTLVNTGHTFGGWSDCITSTPKSGSFMILADTDFCPIWNVVKTVFTLHYDGNGFSGGSAPSDVQGSGVISIEGNSGLLTKAGNTFGGWNTSLNGTGTHYAAQSPYNLTVNATLYAEWTPQIIYIITYDGNVNSTGTAPNPTSGSGLVNLANNSGLLTKVGNTFGGWNTANDGSGLAYPINSPYNLYASIKLFAVWAPIGVTFQVTYDGNGASTGTIPNPTIGSGSVTLDGNSGHFTKSGNIFSGWNTKADGSGAFYGAPSGYNLTATIIMYAMWVPDSANYTVTYKGNGYSGGTPPNPTTGLGPVILASNSGVLIKLGNTFGGWNTRADGSGTPYPAPSSYGLYADINMYAVWVPVINNNNNNNFVYTVTYSGNTNTGGNVPQPTLGLGSVTLASNGGVLVKAGSTFGGWNTSSSGTGTAYPTGSHYNLIADITLYAVWTPANIVYTITYSGNGSSGGVAPSPTIGSGSVTLANNSGILVKSGSSFGGWNTKADGSGISYPVSSGYTLSADITLYAMWNKYVVYTITYNPNGSTGGSAPTPTVGSGSVTLATNSGSLVKTGNTYVDWNTAADGTGTSYAINSDYILTSNITMYATFAPLSGLADAPDLIANGKIVATAPQKKIALNQIVPVHQQFLTVLPTNAIGFQLYENEKLITSGESSTKNLQQIVGPRDRVTVVSVGKDGQTSAPALVTLSKEPISLANINFNTDSYQFVGPATKILDQVAAVILQHGYTVLEIWGYVDTQGSKASWITLSNNRAKAVKDYMTKKLKGSGVIIKNAGRAQTQAVGNNNTAEGRALNRRVEIRVS